MHKNKLSEELFSKESLFENLFSKKKSFQNISLEQETLEKMICHEISLKMGSSWRNFHQYIIRPET
jgi:hypothetical protein